LPSRKKSESSHPIEKQVVIGFVWEYGLGIGNAILAREKRWDRSSLRPIAIIAKRNKSEDKRSWSENSHERFFFNYIVSWGYFM
jgi:hypothetical protein